MEESEETSTAKETNNETNRELDRELDRELNGETSKELNRETSKEGCVKCNGVNSSTKNDNEIVVLNVAGLKFKTKRGTLRRYPDTLLGESLSLYSS